MHYKKAFIYLKTMDSGSFFEMHNGVF